MPYTEIMDGGRPFDDIEWVASDSRGRIGIFITAGFGPVPRLAYINEFEFICFKKWVGDLKKDICSEIPRGFYVYDYSDDNSGYGWYDKKYAYRRIWNSVNDEIIQLDDTISKIIARNKISDVNFADTKKIHIEKYFNDFNL